MGYQKKGLTKHKVVLHGEVRDQKESKTHRETGVEETLLEEQVGTRNLPVKVGTPPEEMVIREEEMMILTPVMMEMKVIPLPPRTPLLQE